MEFEQTIKEGMQYLNGKTIADVIEIYDDIAFVFTDGSVFVFRDFAFYDNIYEAMEDKPLEDDF